MIAEAIFNSLLRYGVAVFLKPVYDVTKNVYRLCFFSSLYRDGNLTGPR